MDDDDSMFLMPRTFKCQLILSLALITPNQKDGSHRWHVANFGYKIWLDLFQKYFGTNIHQIGIKGLTCI